MKRPLGQHFLLNPSLLNKIIDCSGVSTDDTVVEIGPGPGRMTRLLSERSKQVIAIEKDRRLFDKLKTSLADRKNIELINADALKFPYEDIKGSFRVVANIPYYITTPLIFRLLEYREKITSMTLLLQKEVARRIVASHGSKDYGVLSITIQMYTKPVLEFTVSRRAFSPPPEVDSAVVHFRISSKPIFRITNEELFLKIVKTAFSQRRKTILNGLRSFANAEKALLESRIDPKTRPEQLSIEDFTKLTNVMGSC